MKKTIHLLTILLMASSCARKEAPQPVSQPPVTAPSPSEDNVPFTIPPAAKKQAKYFPEGTPTRAIQDLDDMLDSYIVDPKTPEEKQYNERLKKAVIKGTFDVRELCRLALDKHWGETKAGEQDHFVDLMTRLLQKKAIFSKEQGQKKKKSKTSYQVNYTGHKLIGSDQSKDQSNALAMSSVNIPSQALKIDLNYKLRKTDKGWSIYDVIVDGASLLDNYKYQFDKIIDKEGYPNLVHRMESKLKDLEAKDVQGTQGNVNP